MPVADLRGQTVASNRFGASHFVLRYLLEREDLRPDSEGEPPLGINAAFGARGLRTLALGQ